MTETSTKKNSLVYIETGNPYYVTYQNNKTVVQFGTLAKLVEGATLMRDEEGNPATAGYMIEVFLGLRPIPIDLSVIVISPTDAELISGKAARLIRKLMVGCDLDPLDDADGLGGKFPGNPQQKQVATELIKGQATWSPDEIEEQVGKLSKFCSLQFGYERTPQELLEEVTQLLRRRDQLASFAPDESDDESPQMSSSSSDDQGNSSDTAATRGTSTSSSTAGLAELNSWLYDSCEMGVAAWMRAGASETQGRRRCYFTTGDDVRVGPERVDVLHGLQFALAGDGRVAEDDAAEAPTFREALRRPGVEALGERPRKRRARRDHQRRELGLVDDVLVVAVGARRGPAAEPPRPLGRELCERSGSVGEESERLRRAHRRAIRRWCRRFRSWRRLQGSSAGPAPAR